MIKDCYSNRIVGYSIDSRMKASLAVAALSMAIARRHPGPGLVVHSDRGSQGEFNWSSQHPVTNVLNRRRWDTRDQLRLAIVSWIERTYHRRRPQRTLGRLTPIEFETINRVAHAA